MTFQKIPTSFASLSWIFSYWLPTDCILLWFLFWLVATTDFLSPWIVGKILTRDIWIMRRIANVLNPFKRSPVTAVLQKTLFSQSRSWTFKKFTKWCNSAQDGSGIPQYLKITINLPHCNRVLLCFHIEMLYFLTLFGHVYMQ
jgi:hypothetical protein